MTKQNKKLLNEIYLKFQQEKHPYFPVEFNPPYKHSDNSTNGLTNCVKDFLNYSGHQAERINTMGRKLSNKQIVTDVVGFKKEIGTDKWIPGTGTNGSADLSCIIFGKSIKIEIKFGKDRQSAAQIEYQQSIEKAGGIYIIVKTFDGFIDWYLPFINQLRHSSQF